MPSRNSSQPTTRERLSTEAARQFAERGYLGTSIGDLAQALGIQKSSIYSHINGKEDLLVEITNAGVVAFHAALDEVEDADPGERPRLAFRAHLHVVRTQLDVATVWLREWRFLRPDAREEFMHERHRYEDRFRGFFEAAIDAGTMRPDLDLDHTLLIVFSLGNWALTWMSGNTDVDTEADAFWELLQDGLGAP